MTPFTRRRERGAISVRTAFLVPCLLLLFIPLTNYLLLKTSLTELEQRQKQTSNTIISTLRNIVANNLNLLDNPDAYRSERKPLFVTSRPQDIDLDGRLNEWPNDSAYLLDQDTIVLGSKASEPTIEATVRLLGDDTHLYIFFDVLDSEVVYREISNISIHRNDHIRLAMMDRNGQFNRYTLATQQPGTVYGREVSTGGRALRREPGIEAFWRATDLGYQVEAKIDRTLITGALAINIADVDDNTQREILHILGTSQADQPDELSPLIQSAPALSALFAELGLNHIEFRDAYGNLLAQQGQVDLDSALVLPLVVNDTNYGEFIYSLDPASNAEFRATSLKQMLIASVAVLLAGILLSVLLARSQMARIKQLGVALESMVDDQGRVQGAIADGASDDVIGELRQRFANMTRRLHQYNEYLELLSRRLAHELRTPVSVVRSSLEHLSLNVDEHNQKYVQRANNGVARLTNILNSMSEASRLEQSLDQDEVRVFSLTELVKGCFEGYEQAFPEQSFEYIDETHDLKITGIPELFAQMLDKVIDNAVQFSTAGQLITLRLSEDDDENALLRVSNSGPGLPATMSDQLFDPMISVRGNSAREDSHLGLGLYVARLIAEFHGGTIQLKNREDREGVVATIQVPLLRLTSKLA